MEEWEKALDNFLTPWKKREDVIGLLVCGSYITGTPSKRSDIDLHIITSEENDWRERGNKLVEGFHIEYFVNPPKQIRSYFKEDYASNKIDSQTQFITGKILYDKDGSIEELKQEAQRWIDKNFKEIDETSLNLGKYFLWDIRDNLRDLYEKKSMSFRYAYYLFLSELLRFYSRFLRWEIYSPVRVFELMTEVVTQKKYLQNEFPDEVFSDMFVEAISVKEESSMLECFNSLVDYVFRETGGFTLDGWKIRTPLELI